MALLGGVDTADFNFLIATLGLSKGNLSSHVEKLESAGYVRVTKSFNGKIPCTEYALTPKGRKCLDQHWITGWIRSARSARTSGRLRTS